MKTLQQIYMSGKSPRVIGFDDSPFDKHENGSQVGVSGIVCRGVRFEGMLFGKVQKDGLDATDVLANMLLNSKFYAHVHLVLLDGLTFGGFNMVDLPELSRRLALPCASLMRKQPDMDGIRAALKHVDDAQTRLDLMEKAGPVFNHKNFFYQIQGEGAPPEILGKTLERLTDEGYVPEALRLAHLIGSAIVTGQSGKRA